MKRTLLFFWIPLALLACDDNSDNFTAGEYEGIFYRTTPDGRLEEAAVSLTFTQAGFVGGSDRVQYPAICAGTYNEFGNRLEFTNTCAWTAQFDWTLILSGDFILSRQGKTLVLTRHQGNGVIDTYELTRQ